MKKFPANLPYYHTTGIHFITYWSVDQFFPMATTSTKNYSACNLYSPTCLYFGYVTRLLLMKCFGKVKFNLMSIATLVHNPSTFLNFDAQTSFVEVF